MPATEVAASSRRLAYNTVLNIVAAAVTVLVNFWLVRFLLAELGAQQYGVWILIGSIFQYRNVLSLGLNSAINRYVPFRLGRGDHKGLAAVVSTAFVAFCGAATALILLTMVVRAQFSDWFNVPSDYLATAQTLLLIVGVSFALSLPLQLSSAILSGIQRYDIINGITMAVIVARALLLVVMLQQGFGLLTVGLLYGSSEIVMRLLQFFYSRRLLPQARISLRSFDPHLLREMAAYGTNTILYTMGAVILYQGSSILIGVFIGPAEISYFSVAMAGVLLLTEFTQVLSSALKPAISALDARGEHARIAALAALTQKLTLLALIPSVCFFVVFGRDFLRLWLGERVADTAALDTMATIMTIMAVAHGIRLAQHSNFVVLNGRGEHRIFGLLTIATAFLFALGGLVSLAWLDLGVIAVAWSNFIPVVVMSGLVVPIYYSRKMSVPLWVTARQVWLPAIVGTLPGVAFVIGWKYLLPVTSWLHLLALVAWTALITFAWSWTTSLTGTERARMRDLLVRRIR